MEARLYALIEIQEWGEDPAEKWIGPYSPEDPEASADEQCDALRENLEAQGDVVLRVEAR